MDSLEATVSAIMRIFDYKTRSSRSEFWWFFLLFVLCFAAFIRYDYLYPQVQTQILEGWEGNAHKIVVMVVPIFYIISLAIFVSLTVRRLHDLGKSGWHAWKFVFAGPFGFLYWLWWLGKPGMEGGNQFGLNPLEVDEDY